MQAKEQLSRIKWLNFELKKYLELQEQTYTELEGIKSQDFSKLRVCTSVSFKDKMADGIAMLEECADFISARLRELATEKNCAMRKISQIEDSKLRVILISRYFEFKSWEVIATEMNYSEDHIYKLHGLALLEYGKIKDNSK